MLAVSGVPTAAGRLPEPPAMEHLCGRDTTPHWFGGLSAMVRRSPRDGLLGRSRSRGSRGRGRIDQQRARPPSKATRRGALAHQQSGCVPRAGRTWVHCRVQPPPARNGTTPLRARLNQRPRLRAMACSSRRCLGISFGCTTAPRMRSSNCALRMRMCSVEVSTRYIWPR
jgi:hypothetical protein